MGRQTGAHARVCEEYDGTLLFTIKCVFYTTNTIPLLNWKITNLIELKTVHEISVRNNNYFNYLFDITAKVSAAVARKHSRCAVCGKRIIYFVLCTTI